MLDSPSRARACSDREDRSLPINGNIYFQRYFSPLDQCPVFHNPRILVAGKSSVEVVVLERVWTFGL